MTRRRSGLPHKAKLGRILNSTRWKCWLCRNYVYYVDEAGTIQFFEGPFALTVDHVIPHSKGGTSDEMNLNAAHFCCNWLRDDAQHELTDAQLTLIDYIYRVDPHGDHYQTFGMIAADQRTHVKDWINSNGAAL